MASPPKSVNSFLCTAKSQLSRRIFPVISNKKAAKTIFPNLCRKQCPLKNNFAGLNLSIPELMHMLQNVLFFLMSLFFLNFSILKWTVAKTV